MKVLQEREFEPWKVDLPAFKDMWARIAAARQEGAYRDWLESRFWGCLPAQDEVIRVTVANKKEIYDALGLDEYGYPIKGRKYKVFLRVTCLVSEDVVAKDPNEAREKAMEQWEQDDGDPLFCADRSDVDEVEPVAYDEGDGNTKDFDS